MSPDDPRHGTYAGWQAHQKSDRQVCNECKAAQRRYFKSMTLRLHRGQRTRIPLGEDAWGVIARTNRSQLASASGLRPDYLSRLLLAGPTKHVYDRTRDRILAAELTYSTIGIQRRIRALAAMGWSFARLSEECGVAHESLGRLARHSSPAFVRAETAARIVPMYERLELVQLPQTASVTAAKRCAEKKGWVPPLCWDEGTIDDPNAEPHTNREPGRRGISRGELGSVELAAEWDFLRSLGESMHSAAKQLGVGVAAIEKAVERVNRRAA